jgi:hypothetical protein
VAETSGGGMLPESGVPSGAVRYRAVTRVTLTPFSAAVLLNALPATGEENRQRMKSPNG